MFVKLYLVAFPVFLAIDMLWLTLVAKTFYAKYLGFLMAKNPQLFPAFLFYLIFIAGIIFFVVIPALDKNRWLHVLYAGAFFGLVTYATYDLTNLATLKDWPLIITLVDLLWGTLLSATVSILTYLIARTLGL